MTTMLDINAKVNALVDAILDARGCSRLIAASFAAQYALDEYNRIQASLGSKSESQIVDSGYLNELILNQSSEDTSGDLAPGEDMDGDHASALASAGFGTDEDYEHGTPGLDE